jgi:SAM-dependent methyltransferase
VTNNPGGFKPRRVKGLKEIAGMTARRALSGHVLSAGALGLAESANWGMARLGRWLPPRVLCPCCGYSGASFMHMNNRSRTAWNSACPMCDSRSRHRGLALWIPQLLARREPRTRVLHIAPEAVLRRVVEPLSAVYHTSDLKMEGVTYPGEDLTRSRLPPAAYDVLLCNHVLEHIRDDAAAVRNIARTLVEDGIAIVTIPGIFTRRETIQYPDDSLNGHWRDYGLEVVDLFGRFFREVETVNLHEFDQAGGGLSHGIAPGETAFLLREPLTQARA